ncbi:MAG: hypothetical protein R3F62_28820 [Planctomycetota bacterium]
MVMELDREQEDWLCALPQPSLQEFARVVALYLTVHVRGVLTDQELTNEVKLERIRALNEVVHVAVGRPRTPLALFEARDWCAEHHPEVVTSVDHALRRGMETLDA